MTRRSPCLPPRRRTIVTVGFDPHLYSDGPDEQPEPRVPAQRPPADVRRSIVGINALARMHHRAGTFDVIRWDLALHNEPGIVTALGEMELQDSLGEGW